MDVLNVLKNVIAIIGIIAAGAFVIVFLADLLISIIDGKNGIFFKRGNVEAKQEPAQEQQPRRERVLELEEKNERDEVKLIDEPQQNVAQEPAFGKVDFDKADEEERLLRERLQFNVVEEEEKAIDEQIKKDSEEEELRARIRELEEKNKELTDALLNTTAPEAEPVAEVEEDDEDSDDMIDYFNEYKDIIDSITADATKEEEEVAEEENVLPSIDDILMQEETVEAEPVAEPEPEPVVEPEPEPVVEPEPEPVVEEEVIPAVVEEEVAPVEELNEEDNKLLAEIEELRRQLEEEKARMEEVRQEAMYKTAMLEGEKERLAEELRIANEQREAAEAASKEVTPVLMSKEECEARLETLKERLKANEKQLRVCKKEYKPLERVNKTLNSDKQKLRRKEAIVAKQKVLLYGVNNYVDIDEEKAKKLAEDLDLLDGLRLSVQHCEEVMNANRDRFPILEQTYKILTETNKQIIADIKECEATLEEIKKNENPDDVSGEDK